MEPRKVLFVSVLAALVVAGCASVERTTARLDEQLDDIVRWWPGRYSGEAQLPGASPGEFAPIYHEIALIDAPQFGDNVYAYTLRRTGFDGPVLQQKIFAFDTDPLREQNRMSAWVFAPHQIDPSFAMNPGSWRKISPDELMSFPAECAFGWRATKAGFLATVTSDDCEFDSRAFEQKIRPDMSYAITRGALTWAETLRGAVGETLVTTSGSLRAERVGPVLDVRRTFYDVEGDTVADLRRDLYANASVEDDGETRVARADWQVSWQIGQRESDTGCGVADVGTTASVAYLLPRWASRDAAPAALRAEWDAFFAALLKHELRHQRFAVDAAIRVEAEASMLEELPTCEALDEAIDVVARNIVDNARRRERQYDYTTRFGKAEGAEFPQPEE